jgi:hypothetical protein
MVDVYNPRQVREEVGKLIKDIQEMENATNKLLESLMNAVSQTGDMNSISDKGYLMTLAQMQAVNNTVVCRVAKLLTLLVIWDSHNIENKNLGEKATGQKPVAAKTAPDKIGIEKPAAGKTVAGRTAAVSTAIPQPVPENTGEEKKPSSISERI